MDPQNEALGAAQRAAWFTRIENNPQDGEAFWELAHHFFECGEWDKALLSVSQSLRIDASRDSRFHLLGLVLAALGQAALAAQAFTMALRLNPSHPSARACRRTCQSEAVGQTSAPAELVAEVESWLALGEAALAGREQSLAGVPSGPLNVLAPSAAPASRIRERLSACLIVRNEAGSIERCLRSVLPWAGEVVVVDTGSTDATVAIAEALGARVLHFAWCDDFSAARNVALEAATKSWALVLDADEVLEVLDEAALAGALEQEALAGFSLRCVNRQDGGGFNYGLIFRLFRRDRPGMRYRGRLHEQVGAVADGLVATAGLEALQIHHDGYTQAAIVKGDKRARNLALARAQVEAEPNVPFSWFTLGLEQAQADLAAMVDSYERALQLLRARGESGAGELYVARMHIDLARAYQHLGRSQASLDVIERGIALFPDSADLRFERGHQRWSVKDHAGAVEDLTHAIGPATERFGYLSDSSMRGYRAKCLLGMSLLQLGRNQEAQEWLESALLESPPDFVPVRQALGMLRFQAGEWEAAAELLGAAVAAAPDEAASRFKWGWALFKLGRYEAAIEALRPLAEEPRAQELLGLACLEVGQGPRALAYLTSCPLPSAGLARGWAHYVQGAAAAAAVEWEQWLRAGAADWGTKDALARFMFLMLGGALPAGEPERPAEPLRHMDDWFRLLLRYRCFDEVEQVIRRGPRLGARLWEPLRLKFAQTLTREGLTDVALPLLLEAQEAAPQDADVYYWLGVVAEQRGQLEEAQALWDACLELVPTHALARRKAQELPEGVTPSSASAKPTVSACLIVKDEAANLPRCLASLRGVVDEIVVVDTGSSDDTVAIAESFGAKIGHFAWCDDFSAARNASLDMATSDWILVIDADEALVIDAPEVWLGLLESREVSACALPLHNINEDGSVDYETRLLRLVRRMPELRFSGRLHETFEPALQRLGLAPHLCQGGIRLLHTGHQASAFAERAKGARNLRLAELQVQAEPENPEAWFNLAHSQGLEQDYAGALASYARLESLPGGRERLNPALWTASIQNKQEICQRLGRFAEALQTLDEGVGQRPDDVALRYERGKLRALLADVDGAIADFKACLASEPGRYAATAQPGLTDVLPTQALLALAEAHPARKAEIAALLPEGLGGAPSAIEALFARLERDPRDGEAYMELAFHFYRGGDLDKALLAISQALRLDASQDTGFHLLGLVLAALGQGALAAQAFQAVLSLNPAHPQARECRRNSQAEATGQPLPPPALAAEVAQLLALRFAPPPAPAKPTVSACLIVKDEAANLPRCLASLRGLVDEIVVVDTGSSDETVAIAESFGAKIGHFAWRDDFSAARNASLDLATCDWILVIDADEALAVEDAEAWRGALAVTEADLLSLEVRNWHDEATIGSRFSAWRLLRRRAGLRFRGRLHEDLAEALKAAGGRCADMAAAALNHYGYTAEALARLNKQERNARLAEALASEGPEHPESWYHLARSRWFNRDARGAQEALARLDELARAGRVLDAGRARTAELLVAWVSEALNAPDVAERRLALAAERFPDFAELPFERGRLLSQRRAWAEARACFERCLALASQPVIAPLRQGVTGFLAHIELAAIEGQLGNWTAVRFHLRSAAEDSQCPAEEVPHLLAAISRLPAEMT